MGQYTCILIIYKISNFQSSELNNVLINKYARSVGKLCCSVGYLHSACYVQLSCGLLIIPPCLVTGTSFCNRHATV